MIVQCPDCTTRYQLDPERVPAERIRVRCPKCRYVFPIDGTMAHDPVVAPPEPAPVHAEEPSAPSEPTPSLSAPEPSPVPEPTPVPEPEPEQAEEPAPAVHSADPSALDLEIERPAARAKPAAAAPAADPAVAVAEPEAAPEPAPAEAEDPERKKARRLARALVSDILVYNRETRDKALAEGNLVQALGSEIKKSWELYKERVGAEVANGNNDFREALNEILADGQKIF